LNKVPKKHNERRIDIMKQILGYDRQSKWLLAALMLICVYNLSGCAITLVSTYDEQTDMNVTALQKKFDVFFLTLEGLSSYPDCSYTTNKPFYDDSKEEISGIQFRANIIPKNDITIKKLDSLSKAFSSLEDLHKLKDKAHTCLSKEEIEPNRTAFNSIFTMILKFEIAKKRGDVK
jgi:hypothetical protein